MGEGEGEDGEGEDKEGEDGEGDDGQGEVVKGEGLEAKREGERGVEGKVNESVRAIVRNDDGDNNEDDDEEEGEDDEKKQDAVHTILQSKTAEEFIENMTLYVPDSWLDYNEVRGNIYRIAAFGGLKWKCEGFTTECLSQNARVFGGFLVFLFQLCGPPAIFLGAAFGWGISKERETHWLEWTPSLDDWHHMALTKVIAMVAVSLFAVNALFTCLSEKQSWVQTMDMYRVMPFGTKGTVFLYLDAVVNLWTMTFCTIAAIVVLARRQTTEDVLFDCLGLVFLFNLDDIDGDTDFVSGPDWPSYRLAWIHKEISENMRQTSLPEIVPRDRVVKALFDIIALFLGLVAFTAPIFIAVTPTLKIVPQAYW